MSNPIQAVVVGAGHRSLTYASYAREHPEEMKIVGVVDPSERRRGLVAIDGKRSASVGGDVSIVPGSLIALNTARDALRQMLALKPRECC